MLSSVSSTKYRFIGTPEQEREALAAVMENTPEAHLAYLDGDFNFVMVNSTYAEAARIEKAELIGRNHFELFPNEENQAIFERARETGEPVEYRAKPFVYENQPERGVTYWDWTLTPLKGDDGQVRAFVLSLVDVTEHVLHSELAEALAQLDVLIHSTLEFEEMLGHLLIEAVEASGFESAGLALKRGDSWEVYARTGELRAPVGVSLDPAGAALVEMAAVSREPVVIEDVASSPFAAASAPLGIRSILSVPLIVRDEVVGVLGFNYHTEPKPIGEDLVEFAERLAASLSLALANARLHDRARKAASLEGALNRMLTAFISARKPSDVLREVVEESLEALQADYSLILEIENRHWVTRHAFGAEGSVEVTQPRYPLDARPLLVQAVEKRQIEIVEDVSTHEKVNREIAERFGIRAFAVVPLVLRGEVLGVLELTYLDGPRYFDEAEVDFLDNLMVAASLALEQSRELEQERHVAKTLQQGLLALPDRIRGIDFAHTYHSASEASMVGGDFYDLFEVEHGRIGITVGDISGKGVDAAVLTSLVKNTIRAHAIEEGKTPADVMNFANQVMLHGSSTETFATVFFGVLDRIDGRLVYCNAAHTTAAVVNRDGEVRGLPATSALVGAFGNVLYFNEETRLAEGDLLFLYTDGLVEARFDGEQFGEERVFQRLSALWHGDPGEVADPIIDAAVDFAGGLLADDLATLALTRSTH